MLLLSAQLRSYVVALFLAGVKRAWGSYEELAKDSEVDIVYVSNVHPAHKDTTLLMLGHGKHVLCEKPIAVRAQLCTIKFNPKKRIIATSSAGSS